MNVIFGETKESLVSRYKSFIATNISPQIGTYIQINLMCVHVGGAGVPASLNLTMTVQV